MEIPGYYSFSYSTSLEFFEGQQQLINTLILPFVIYFSLNGKCRARKACLNIKICHLDSLGSFLMGEMWSTSYCLYILWKLFLMPLMISYPFLLLYHSLPRWHRSFFLLMISFYFLSFICLLITIPFQIYCLQGRNYLLF